MLETLDGVLLIVLNEGLRSGGVIEGGVVGRSGILESEGSTESDGRRNEVSKDVSTPSWIARECNDMEGNRMEDS